MTGEVHPDVTRWAVAQARTVGRSDDVSPTSGDEAPLESATGSTPTGPLEIAFDEPRALSAHSAKIRSVDLVISPEGRLLLATAGDDGVAKIWDAETGTSLEPLRGHNGDVLAVAWAPIRDDRLSLATGGSDGTVQVWDGRTGRCLHVLPGHEGAVWSVAWSQHSGPLRLATGGDDRTVRTWNVTMESCEQAMPGHRGRIMSVAWGRQADDRPLLATGASDGTAQIWDPDKARSLQTLDRHADWVRGVAWSRNEHGALQLATASFDRTARIWDPYAGHSEHVLIGHAGTVWSLAWAPVVGGRSLIATGGWDGTARVWNATDGRSLAVLKHPDDVSAVAWIALPDGRLALATGARDGVARVWRTVTTLTDAEPRFEPDDVEDGHSHPRPAAHELVLLGSGGMWIALALLSDVIALTGARFVPQATRLYDPRLRALGEHPGIERLRALDWPAAARTAFAGLLAADLLRDPGLAPPTASATQEQLDALKHALAGKGVHEPRSARTDVNALIAAADAIDGRILTLLTIIGPEAAAMDPLLVLKLAHHSSTMPALDPMQLRLLAAATAIRADPRPNALSVSRAPGVSGVTRHGPPTTLLLTQLAIPEPLFDLRFAYDELLHRHHPATTTPPIQELTLVLDTSPATFGEIECVLRLAAYLTAIMLQQAGHNPKLVTSDRPEELIELTNTHELVTIWARRTLDEPDLATALQTAEAAAHPTLTLTTHHMSGDHPPPSARHQLLTSHHPRFPPGKVPMTPFRHHVPPGSSLVRIAQVIHAVFEGAAKQTAGTR